MFTQVDPIASSCLLIFKEHTALLLKMCVFHWDHLISRPLEMTLLGQYQSISHNSSPRSKVGPYQKVVSHFEIKIAV